ncbi:LAMP3 protein, partial [Urocolius indicus]|nr:LAMP3 protein [Urocolius indicus]
VGQATTQAMGTVVPAVRNTTIHAVSTTQQAGTAMSTEMTTAATNTTIGQTVSSTPMTAAATTAAATTVQTVKPSTGSGNQTTAPKSPTTPPNTTTIHPGTQTTIPRTTRTVRPTPAPQPSAIPTGTYTVSSGNRTCVKAVMGLQLVAQNTRKQMEYLAINPNTTQTSGSCGMTQSELNLTFIEGFINFAFVK